MRDKKFLLSLPKEAQMEREKFLEQSKETCPFCAIQNNSLNARRADVALETPSFVTLIDVAPPTDFYFVTFPKEHTLAYYEADESLAKEFNRIAEMLIEKTGMSNILFFENGAGNRPDGSGYGIVSNQSVYHAHVNMMFLPDGFHVIDKITDRFNSLNVPHFQLEQPTEYYPTQAIRSVTEGRPYFYVRQMNNAKVFMEQGEKVVPSQFVRRCVTEVYNGDTDLPFWDWKNVRIEEYPILEQRKAAMRSLFT